MAELKMNRKIIGTILCISVLLMSSVPIIGANPISYAKNNDELLQKAIELVDNENVTTIGELVISTGPVSKVYSEVELLDGDADQMKIIQRNLDKKLFRFSRFLPFIFVPVFNLSFTVEYKLDLENGSKFSYLTLNTTLMADNQTGEIVNSTDHTYCYNTIHKVHVENMTGLFFFNRARLYDKNMPAGQRFFIPAKFIFVGICENITYLPVE